ncbi:MAG TPA: post-COAP-1 domain-containing protein, partial [Acidimicrobiales bacterium]|nr:post-COAP-1 domain-containing protein [Acidimicrobiales bacterium]
NEQTTTDGVIAVNALRLVVPGQADVALASASAGITCAGSPECTAAADRITGGGWITVAKAKANFGVAGGTVDGALWGHLSYQDKAKNLTVKGTKVTAYRVTGTTTRRIEGTADINGKAGTYVVDVADNKSAGKADTFAIALSSGYTASAALGGGDITLHLRAPCP